MLSQVKKQAHENDGDEEETPRIVGSASLKNQNDSLSEKTPRFF
jgi:transcription elongation GreA/GreB family factor